MRKDIILTDRFLSLNDTAVMKAVAITCMLMHHLWCFPNRIASGQLDHYFNFFNVTSISFVGFFGKICVPLFFFLGGYGVYRKYVGKKYDIVERLKKLYFAYWKVFLIFIPIGFIFFSTQDNYCADPFIRSRFATFSSRELFSNFLGITATYNREWWFLASYAFALMTFPLIRAIIDRYSAKTNIFIAIIATILVVSIFPGLGKNESLGILNNNILYRKLFCQIAPYASCFWMGAVVARNRLLERLNYSMKKNGLLNPIVDIIVWWMIVILRQNELGSTFDIFFIPVLTVVTIDLVNRVKTIKKGIAFFGKQSTNMWLIHTFFCFYFGAVSKIVTFTQNAILSLITLMAMSCVAGILVDLFWKGIGLGYNKAKSLKNLRRRLTPT